MPACYAGYFLIDPELLYSHRMTSFLQAGQECLVNTLLSPDVHESGFGVLQATPLWVLIALLVSPLVLRLYKRRVTQLMNTRQGSDDDNTSTLSLLNKQPFITQSLPGFGLGTATEILDLTLPRVRQHRRRVLAVGLIHLMLLFCLALYSNYSYEMSYGWLTATIATLGTLVYFALLATSLVTLIYGNARFASIAWLSLVPMLISAFILYLLMGGDLDIEDMAYGLTAMVLFAAAIFAAVCGRQLKNIVPYLTIALAVSALVALLLDIVYQISDCTFDIGSNTSILLTVTALSVLSVLATIIKLFQWVARLYADKILSDTQVQVCSWIIMMSLSLLPFLQVVDEESVALTWTAWLTLPITVLMLGVYLLSTRHLSPWTLPQRLLLLRVFTQDKRGEKTLNKIERIWRHIGPVYLIAGPDLAKTSADPDELYLFLTRRLKTLFIADREMAQASIASIDNQPDPDGRFRVNEMFCFDNQWETMALGLVYQSDSVLLDLRDFHIGRLGTAREIKFLARFDALSRTLILVDDEDSVQDCIDSIKSITGLEISEEQFVKPAEHTGEELVHQLLTLKQKNLSEKYVNADTAKIENIADTGFQQQALLIRHKRIVNQHKKQRYPFSYLLLFGGLAGMIVGGGLQYLATLYLLVRRASFKHAAIFFVVSLVYSLLFTYLDPLGEAANTSTTGSTDWWVAFAALVGAVATWLLIWIPLCRRANRWIAQGREPLRTALRHLKQ